jgi:hypothetical protein
MRCGEQGLLNRPVRSGAAFGPPFSFGELLKAHRDMDLEELPPPRVEPRLLVVPAIRELYWCDFPADAQLPEFWKRRPVIVVSFKKTAARLFSVK